MKRYLFHKFNKIVSILFLFIIWYAISLTTNPIILPSPLVVLSDFIQLLSESSFYSSTYNTLLSTWLGTFGAIFTGVFLGYLSAISRKVDNMINPLTLVIQSAPIISWILLSLIWFDNSIIPVIVVGFSAMPIVYITVRTELFKVFDEYKEFIKIYHLKGLKLFKNILLPAIFISLKSSIRIVTELALKISVMAEVISNATGGLGEGLNNFWINVETSKVIAITLGLIIITTINVKIVNRILIFFLGKYQW
ncbi:MAG: ABC transporter permease subunit [Candidatus Delongbacteria bacterium]|nr:ABC transporter permease subunit [Candidatus Delongbacteria bacterium]MBN2833860.1 ABC transporter permease subunit [Candidatus Delongbacteria bacterium]